LLGKSEYLANNLCLRLERNGLTVHENDAVGDAPNVLTLSTTARVYGFPLIGASRVFHLGGNQLKDWTSGIHCGFEFDIAVLARMEQHSELAQTGNGSDAIKCNSTHAVDSDHQYSLWARRFGCALDLIDEIAEDLAGAFGARSNSGEVSCDGPPVA
jgi:hypothetical protein